MKKDILINNIRENFKDITLGDAYTLAEKDYYDTAHCHFDDMHVNRNMTREAWVKQEIHLIDTGGWLPEDREDAIQALKEKRRMVNRYKPLEVPPIYLNYCATGLSFIEPQGFLFYTPSVMLYALNDTEGFNSNSFNSWLFNISYKDSSEKRLEAFSKKQIITLLDFLEYIINLLDRFDREIAIEALNRIKLMSNL